MWIHEEICQIIEIYKNETSWHSRDPQHSILRTHWMGLTKGGTWRRYYYKHKDRPAENVWMKLWVKKKNNERKLYENVRYSYKFKYMHTWNP